MRFGDKRNIHIMLPQQAYVKTKIATFERQLTLQDAVSGFIAAVADGDDRAVSLLDEIALLKYNGTLQERLINVKMSKAQSDLLYTMLESEDA